MTAPHGLCRLAPVRSGYVDWAAGRELDIRPVRRDLTARQRRLVDFIAGYMATWTAFGLAYAVVESLVRGLQLERLDYTTPYLTGGYPTLDGAAEVGEAFADADRDGRRGPAARAPSPEDRRAAPDQG